MPLRRYRCPHCKSVQRAEPHPGKAMSVGCDSCGKRFRIPKARGPQRRQTSIRSVNVKAQLAAQAEAMRSQSSKEKLDRIVRERRFGEYDILDELGRGGMGVVFKAFHRGLKRMVALKVVLPDADDQETMLKRFRREAELHARLRHPNIVHVYDSGEIDGIHYFAMDFVTGTQLTKLMGQPEFPLEERVEIARQLADALDHAHTAGVVHRDIKPDNIIVDNGWSAHLVDFGIAKPTDMSGMENITRQGLAVGTPHYMAPEQFRPKLGKVGPQSDVYSLGAVLYHALAGHAPFEADTAHQVLIAAATRPVPPLSGKMTPSDEKIPDDLAAIVLKAMEKQPSDRYRSAQALGADLTRYSAGEEVSAFPLSGFEKMRRKLTRNRQLVGAFALITILVVVTLAGFTMSMLALGWQKDDVSEAVSETKSSVSRVRKVADDEEAVEAEISSLKDRINGIEKKSEAGVNSVMLIFMITSGLTFIVLVGFGIFLVLMPLLRRPEASEVEISPDEIGATADEVVGADAIPLRP